MHVITISISTFQPTPPESGVSGKDFPRLKEVSSNGKVESLYDIQACQRGDPLSTLKKQLEEKEKLLTTEQEDAATAKNRIRELSKVSQAAFRSCDLFKIYSFRSVGTVPGHLKILCLSEGVLRYSKSVERH